MRGLADRFCLLAVHCYERLGEIAILLCFRGDFVRIGVAFQDRKRWLVRGGGAMPIALNSLFLSLSIVDGVYRSRSWSEVRCEHMDCLKR